MYDLQIEFPAPPIPAIADVRDRRAHDGRRRGARDADRGRRSTRSPPSSSRGGRRGGRGLLPQLLRQPGQRAAGRRAPPQRARRAGVHLGRGLAADPRVPAHDHDGVQRGHDAGDRARTSTSCRSGSSAEGFGGSVLMMLSNGGVVSADDAARVPIRLVESGPAAGALAGSWFARRLGEDRLLCFDMGGTTAKSCLIERRRARAHEHLRGRPHLPLQEGLGLPGLGAVGRPRRDRRRRRQPRPRRRARPAEGRARVGRRRPRPGRATAAAAREPAVTDADVLLGLLDPDYFLGGDMPLDAARPPTARRPRRRRARPRRRRHRGGHPRGRQPEHGRGGPHARRRAGRRPARRRRASRSAAPARCTPAAWPSCSSPTGSSSRSTPACCRRSARW